MKYSKEIIKLSKSHRSPFAFFQKLKNLEISFYFENFLKIHFRTFEFSRRSKYFKARITQIKPDLHEKRFCIVRGWKCSGYKWGKSDAVIARSKIVYKAGEDNNMGFLYFFPISR